MNIFWLVVIVLTLSCISQIVISLRISEVKCLDYAQISENTSIVNKNVLLLKHATLDPTKLWSVGTLISEQFILSAYHSDYNWVGVKVYHTYDTKYLTIDAYYKRPIYNTTGLSYGIVLIQLRTPLELNSFNRPACLWTMKEFDSTWAELLLTSGEIDDPLKLRPIQIVNNSVCRNIYQRWDTLNLFCLHPTRNYNRSVSTIGSPIQVKRVVKGKLTNDYVYGILLGHRVNKGLNNFFVGKLFSLLDWIEPRVWEFQDICGRQQIDMIPLINLPQTARFGEFPWHAAVIEDQNGQRKYLCGGTILNEETVLTAAHCVFDRSLPSIFIGVGYNTLNRSIADSITRILSEIIIHPNYHVTHLENDIAVLKLQNPLKYSRWIQPICLTSNTNMFQNEIGSLPGWGVNEKDEFPNQLMKASFPIRTARDCRDSNRQAFGNMLTENNFCAGYRNGTTACVGDSGGGLVFILNNQWYILGLVSWGVPANSSSKYKCDPRQMSLFTNVTQYYDWILDKL